MARRPPVETTLARPTKTYSFTDFSKLAPMAPIPGDRLDTELNELRAKLTATVDVLKGLLDGSITLPGQGITIDIPGVVDAKIIDLATGQVRGSKRRLPMISPQIAMTPEAYEALNAANAAADTAAEQARVATTHAQNTYSDALRINARAAEAEEAARAVAQLRGLTSADAQLAEAAARDAANDENHALLAAEDANFAQQLAWKWAEYISGPVMSEEEFEELDPSLIPPGYTYNPVTGMGTAGLWSAKWWAIKAQQLIEEADSDAADSAAAAAASAAAAAASATTAATHAATALTHANSAGTSATAAAGSATAAASSVTAAAAQVTLAAAQVDLAEDQVALAEAAVVEAEAALDEFTDLYLGSGSAGPTTDPDGDPLQVGALFFNTAIQAMTVWDGDSWEEIAAGGGGGSSASSITFVPTGGISATNVQTALVELDTEKLSDAPADGTAYSRRNNAWYAATVDLTPYAALAESDPFTATQIIANTGPQFQLKKAASGQVALIGGYTGSNLRWQAYFGDTTAESGSNVGSDFGISRFSDAGSGIDTPLKIWRSTGEVQVAIGLIPDANDGAYLGKSGQAFADLYLANGGVINWNAGNYTITHTAGLLTLNGAMTLAGNVTIAKASPGIYLDATGTGQARFIEARNGTTRRWILDIGDSSAESTGNAGSNFTLERYDDAGAWINNPLRVWRSTGEVEVAIGLIPDVNDGAYLGKSGAAFSDLWLASGAVIDFGASDITLTHSTDKLSIAGGLLDMLAGARVYLDNTTTGPAASIEQDGTGDATLEFLLTATRSWCVGIDNSDGDRFKIAKANTGFAAADVALEIEPTTRNLKTWGASYTLEAPAATDAGIQIRADAGESKAIGFFTGATARFWIGTNTAAEAGSNAGADFTIDRYNDAGTYQASAFTVRRATGEILLETGMVPDTDGGAYLGINTLGWSGLRLSSGAFIGWNNLDVTLTHSADTLTLAGGNLILPNDPAVALGAATKQYVDNIAAGLDVKPSCRIATTANITLSGLTAIDGVTPIAGDRILVKDQSSAATNGIYVAAAGAWARATDMDAWTEVPGASVWVEEGTANADTAWVATANTGGTIGSTSITWSKWAGSGFYQAYSALLTSIAALATDGILVKTGAVASTMAIATQAEFLAGTADRLMNAAIARTGGAFYSLPTSGAMGVNGNNGIHFQTAPTGTLTFDNPTNIPAGRSGIIYIGSSASDITMDFGTAWYFPNIQPTTRTALKFGVVTYVAYDSSTLICSYSEDYTNA